LTVDDARTRIEDLGGVLRALHDGPTIPVDWSHRANRVTAVTRDDKIVRTLDHLG